ncbi:hypothetical protein SAMN05444277_102167 [Parafilimonas terrae]|uniref:Uncharacterized protein n=1 Tax=Parafilimonas terrae TaxID=1465490 RepID=A0A1I5TJK6_9BACT|nr:hypothetical protein SAMN05444277_102167 [Parafilimonas terrae]
MAVNGKEDFATLAGKTKVTAGMNFKYDYSYGEAVAYLTYLFAEL